MTTHSDAADPILLHKVTAAGHVPGDEETKDRACLVAGSLTQVEQAIAGVGAAWQGANDFLDDTPVDFLLPQDQDALRVHLGQFLPLGQRPALDQFFAVFEVTAAGFDGADDSTDDRIVWVYGTEHLIKLAIAGTGATFGGEVVIREDHPDVDFRLPHDREALRKRLLAFFRAPG